MSEVYNFEIDGKEYELKYSFKMIRRMRAQGINVPEIHRMISADNGAASDYAADICSMAAILLREVGADVTDEGLWHACSADREAMLAVMTLFWWIIGNHYAQPQAGVKHKIKKI